MVTTRNTVGPDILPHTKRAVHFHALGVHLQVSQWKYLDLDCLDATVAVILRASVVYG